jgi:hypothetical protein
MDFKTDDIVVCIDDIIDDKFIDHYNYKEMKSILKLNNKYRIYTSLGTEIVVENSPFAFRADRFKLLSEIRKEKLKLLRNE